MGRPQKRWIDTVKDYLRKRSLDVRQARRMVQGKNEWWGFVKRNAWDITQESLLMEVLFVFVFSYGLTSISYPIVDTLFIS